MGSHLIRQSLLFKMGDILQEVIEVTAASLEPITLAEAKAQARIDTSTTAENDLIEDVYIPAARRWLENRVGMTFHQKTLRWLLNGFPEYGCAIRLRQATPLIAITSIAYKDTAGASTTWGASNYIADTSSKVGRVMPAYSVSYPTGPFYPSWPVQINGTAGIATASPVTEANPMIKLAIAELVSGMWTNRDAEELPDRPIADTIKFSYGVEALISALRKEYVF